MCLFVFVFFVFFFKQKTAYEIYQCDWSSDVCSSDLATFWCDLPFHLPALEPHPSVEPKYGVHKDILVCSSLDGTVDVLSRYLHDIGLRVVRMEAVHDAVMYLDSKRACPSEVLGIMMGTEAAQERWSAWLSTVRSSPFSALKVWGLMPFWFSKRDEDLSVRFDGMITLPIHRDQLYQRVCEEPNRSDQSDRSDRSDGKSGKFRPFVLIVDDNPVNQKVAAGLFGTLGCQVSIAASGQQALEHVQAVAVDLIIMDWELPGMDGFETAHAIRAMEKTNRLKRRSSLSSTPERSGPPPCPHIPIVGMTAHRLSGQNLHSWKTVMDDCLSKPVHLRDLAIVLERWVGFRVQAKDEPSSLRDIREEMPSIETCPPGPCDAVEASMEDVPYDLLAALEFMDGDATLL